MICRYRRQLGDDVYFLTGTDEHGQKCEKSATAMNLTPRQLADQMVTNYKDLWTQLDIKYDRFIRTTDPDHQSTVQAMFSKLLRQGDIYKSFYEGLYSVSEESFVSPQQVKEMDQQGLTGQLISLKEETYFFRLSSYQDKLLDFYSKNPNFVTPDFRFNEVKRFVEGGLQDLSISRTSVKWGIPVPDDPQHIIYVWFDALLNYLSGSNDQFPPQLQIVGKDILRFHAVYWPAFLMSLGLPLPQQILAHGWWLLDDSKMSKSKGNVISPEALMRFGTDSLRFFFIREMQLGNDRSFSYDNLIDRLNNDLSNGIGNFASRTITMVDKYLSKKIPAHFIEPIDPATRSLMIKCDEITSLFKLKISTNDINAAIDAWWGLLRDVDQYIALIKPWELAKDKVTFNDLSNTLLLLLKILRLSAVFITPVMPSSSQKLWKMIGFQSNIDEEKILEQNLSQYMPTSIGEVYSLFPRIDKLSEDAMIDPTEPSLAPEITFDDFAKVKLCVGRIMEATPVEKSEKLLKLLVDIGDGQPRIIVSGIAKSYAPSDLMQKLVVVVMNLAPKKLMGIQSHGMILAASSIDGHPILLDVPATARPGYVVK